MYPVVEKFNTVGDHKKYGGLSLYLFVLFRNLSTLYLSLPTVAIGLKKSPMDSYCLSASASSRRGSSPSHRHCSLRRWLRSIQLNELVFYIKFMTFILNHLIRNGDIKLVARRTWRLMPQEGVQGVQAGRIR